MVVKRNRTLGSFIVNTKTVSPVARAYARTHGYVIRIPHVFKNESKKNKKKGGVVRFMCTHRSERYDKESWILRVYVLFICAFLYNLFNNQRQRKDCVLFNIIHENSYSIQLERKFAQNSSKRKRVFLHAHDDIISRLLCALSPRRRLRLLLANRPLAGRRVRHRRRRIVEPASNTKTASTFTNGRYGKTRYPKFTLRAADETPPTAEKEDEKEDIPPWERRETGKESSARIRRTSVASLPVGKRDHSGGSDGELLRVDV